MDGNFVLKVFESADPKSLLKPTDEEEMKTGALGTRFATLTQRYEGREIKHVMTRDLFADMPKQDPAVVLQNRIEHALGIVTTFNARNNVPSDKAMSNINGVYHQQQTDFIEYARLKRVITSGVLDHTSEVLDHVRH